MHAFSISSDDRLEGVVIRAGSAWAWSCVLDGSTGTAATDWEATAALVAAWRQARKNLI